MQTASLVDRFQALGDPTRFAIVTRLAQGPATVGQLRQPFDISAPAISRHLKVLENAALIEREVRAQARIIRLNPQALTPLKNWIADMERFWHASFDRLDAFLTDEEEQDEHTKPRDRD